MGERAADLITVAPGKQGERVDTSGHDVPKSEAEARKEKRLRAVLRAPEVIQHLYREGLITQADAARLGPKSPTPEKAAQVAEARQEIEQLDTADPQFRKKAGSIVRRVLGGDRSGRRLISLARDPVKAVEQILGTYGKEYLDELIRLASSR